MSWKGQVTLEDTLYFLFTTRKFSTGAPFTLAGTPALSVYEENSLTQITAGVSVSADYDSVTGLNQATVVATAANGYEAGKRYDVVITTGTVDSVSVVGEVVASFEVGPVDANVTQWNGTAVATPATAGYPAVTIKSGTGTGEISLSSGVAAVNVTQFGGSAGSFNSGIAAVNATQISGSATAADNAEIVFATDFATNYSTTNDKWQVEANTLQIEGSDATDQINAACDAAIETYQLDHLIHISGATATIADDSIVAKLAATSGIWSGFVGSTDSLQAIRDRGDSAWTEISAAEVRSAVGLASANLDTQLSTISGYVDILDDATSGNAKIATDVAAVLADTGTDGVVVAAASKTGYTLSAAGIDAVWDEATSGHVTAGTFAVAITDILTDTGEIGSAGAGLTEAGGTGDQLTALATAANLSAHGIKKNTAFNNFMFLMVDATDGYTPETGLTVTATRSLDAGAFGAASGTVTEVGSGWYQFDAAQADTNGDVIVWKFTATGARDTAFTLLGVP